MLRCYPFVRHVWSWMFKCSGCIRMVWQKDKLRTQKCFQTNFYPLQWQIFPIQFDVVLEQTWLSKHVTIIGDELQLCSVLPVLSFAGYISHISIDIQWMKQNKKKWEHSPPPSDVRWSDPRLISRFPILSCNLFDDGVEPLVADFCCCIWFWGCCCWDVVGFLNDVRNPFEGYNGYYRPAIRTQSLLLSLLLYQIPWREMEIWILDRFVQLISLRNFFFMACKISNFCHSVNAWSMAQLYWEPSACLTCKIPNLSTSYNLGCYLSRCWKKSFPKNYVT